MCLAQQGIAKGVLEVRRPLGEALETPAADPETLAQRVAHLVHALVVFGRAADETRVEAAALVLHEVVRHPLQVVEVDALKEGSLRLGVVLGLPVPVERVVPPAGVEVGEDIRGGPVVERRDVAALA